MIDKRIHFIFGMVPDFNAIPFSMIHYLAIRSAHAVHDPNEIYLHYKYPPEGPWWEKARELVTPVRIDPPTSVAGRELACAPHITDYARLLILRDAGGIYLDLDVISVRPFDDLLGASVVVGEQGVNGEEGVGNAVILAEKGAEFIDLWIDGFNPTTSLWGGFRARGRDHYYLEYSTWYPAFLAKRQPDAVRTEPYTSFYWPRAQRSHFDWFFFEDGSRFDASYCHHLWESLSWESHLSKVDDEYVRTVDTNFNRIARRFLD